MGVRWWQLAQGAVRPGGAVVRQVLGQYLAQVALGDDQQPAGDFAPQGPGDPFADGVRIGCLRRAGHNRDAAAGKTAPEPAVNWPARSLIRNLTPVMRGPGSVRKLPAAWVVHAPSGFAVIPARWARRVPCPVTISG
jgi:hypothetical protein